MPYIESLVPLTAAGNRPCVFPHTEACIVVFTAAATCSESAHVNTSYLASAGAASCAIARFRHFDESVELTVQMAVSPQRHK